MKITQPTPASKTGEQKTTLPNPKAYMYCHKCGSSQPKDANFCVKCGTQIAIERSSSTESSSDRNSADITPRSQLQEPRATSSAPSEVTRRELPRQAVGTRQSNERTSSTFAPPAETIEGKSTRDYLLRIEVIGSALLILAFFLPWISIGGIVSVSGYSLPNALSALIKVTKGIGEALGEKQVTAEIDKSNVIWLVRLIYVSPILAICTLIAAVRKSETFVFGFFAGLAPLGISLYGYLRNSSKFDSSILDSLSVGAYLTALGSLLCLLSILRKSAPERPAYLPDSLG